MYLRRQIMKHYQSRLSISVIVNAFLLLQLPTLTWSLMNLSPLESMTLKSRLENIQGEIHSNVNDSITKAGSGEEPTFIFPGAGGVDELVLELQSTIPNSNIIDWKDFRGSVLTAAYDGEAVGEAIAKLVLEGTSSASSIHFIGISVGAFCANAAATTTYHKETSSSSSAITNVRLTLLDPFCGRGVFGPNYGRDNFGKCATTALQILNTDDPVPTTNDPLPNCYCLDVTNAPQRDTFVPLPGDSMHSWPCKYSSDEIVNHFGVFS